MKITELITAEQRAAFSFEVLPPLKGTGIGALTRTVDTLREFDPKYINITTHRSEYVYKDLGDDLVQRTRIRRRPGTVAVAAMLQQKYSIPVVPHILCSGFTREETEYVLLDLQFLGNETLHLLRGAKAKDDAGVRPTPNGYSHTTELQAQVNRFNEGFFVDGSPIKVPGHPFAYGVACYPEKHEEAPNLATDLYWLKQKVDAGAEYAVTQLFYDNAKYFAFVRAACDMGIDIPIIPGIKPLTRRAQLTTVPKVFHCDMPEALTAEALKCTTDEEVAEVGVEWAVAQCRDLMEDGGPSMQF